MVGGTDTPTLSPSFNGIGTNDFAIVKSTKLYANLTNNPIPFAIIQFKGIDYG